MNNLDCDYLNTWGWGANLRVKAHIVNKNNSLRAKVLRIESKDAKIPWNRSIPLRIIGQRGKIIEAIALFNNQEWFLTMEVENLHEN